MSNAIQLESLESVKTSVQHTSSYSRSFVFAALRSIGNGLRAHSSVSTTLAGLFTVVILIASLLPSVVTRKDPYATDPVHMFQAPSAEHWFGTDQLGRDLFARTVYGAHATVTASLLSLAIAVVGGLIIGIASAYVGGFVDTVLMRSVDVLLSIPGLLLSITIVTAIGFGTTPVAVAIGVASLPGFARTTRAQTLKIKNHAYVEAAVVSGVSPLRIVFSHILRNVLGPVSVLAMLEFGAVIMSVATLSFLGFGAKPPAAEWGSLINDGRNYLITSPWISLIPGFVVVLTVLSATVLANNLKRGER